MAVLGCWGAFSGRDFSAWGKWLYVGLLGLIIVGVIGMFTGFGHSFNLLYSLAGMVILLAILSLTSSVFLVLKTTTLTRS
jgi:FtsH-binding integral membrane protein